MSALFKHEVPKFVKGTSVALSICLGLTGAIGLKGIALGDLQVCYGDFVRICRPAELPALPLFVFVAGMMAAFLTFVRIKTHFGSFRKRGTEAFKNEHSL